MATLLEGLEQQTAAERRQAAIDYRELLHRNQSPRPGDAERLREVVALLGLSPVDVKSDLATLRSHAAKRSEILPLERIETMQAAQAKQAAESLKTFREQIKARVDLVDPLRLAGLDGLAMRIDADSGWGGVERDAAEKAFIKNFYHSKNDLDNTVKTSQDAAAALRSIEKSNARLFGAQ